MTLLISPFQQAEEREREGKMKKEREGGRERLGLRVIPPGGLEERVFSSLQILTQSLGSTLSRLVISFQENLKFLCFEPLSPLMTNHIFKLSVQECSTAQICKEVNLSTFVDEQPQPSPRNLHALWLCIQVKSVSVE